MCLPAPGKWLLVLALSLVLAGCEQSRELSEEQRAALEQRVQARWLALMERDFDTVWEFSSPNYRETFPSTCTATRSHMRSNGS